MTNKSRYVSPPVQRAAKLLRYIAEGNALTNVSQASSTLKINRTTLLRLLHTLELEGLIETRLDGAGYQLGLSLLSLSTQAFFSRDLVQISLPIVTKLAETVGLSAHLGVLDETDVIYLVRRTPNVPLTSNIRIGSRLPAHATAMGRIILANMAPAEVEKVFRGRELKRYTAHTPTSLKALLASLERDRGDEIAWSDAYFEAGISSAAAAVFDFSEAPVGAINVSGPVAAFSGKTRRAEIARALLEATRDVSLRLGWRSTEIRSTSAGRRRERTAETPRKRKVAQ